MKNTEKNSKQDEKTATKDNAPKGNFGFGGTGSKGFGKGKFRRLNNDDSK